MKNIFSFIVLGLLTQAVFAQSELRIPNNIKPAYEKETRSYNGKPGVNYWINKSDYKIIAEIDPFKKIIAGSEDLFVHMMNEEAKRLSMHNTHFTNSTGLTHSDHYSTAHDLALLAAAIIRDFPERYPLYSLREYTYNGITQQNRNRLLWTDPNVDGMKTGWTEAAGYCLVTSAKRDQRRLISVVMGTASPNARSIESQRLLNYGFQFFDTAHPYKKDQPVANVQIWKGAQNKLKVGFDRDIYFSLPKGKVEGLKARMEYRQPLIAPIDRGREVGMVKFILDGQEIATYPLVALETVDTASFLGRSWDNLKMLFN